MNSPPYLRARRPEQKQARRAHLVQTARVMLVRGGLKGLSLNGLAREAGMAKSNVYRYFESREALLLQILSIEWSQWSDDLIAELEQRSEMIHPSELAARYATTLGARPHLCELSAALATVLEQNVSVASVTAFKRGVTQKIAGVSEAVARICPALTEACHAELLSHGYVVLVGLWPVCHPPESVREALKQPDLVKLTHHFERDFTRVLTLLAIGLAAIGEDSI